MRPLSAVRSVTTAAVFTAAVVVYVVVRERRLHQELARARAAATSERLMAGAVCRDFDAFRARVGLAAAEHAVVREADLVLSEALVTYSIDPTSEGGPA